MHVEVGAQVRWEETGEEFNAKGSFEPRLFKQTSSGRLTEVFLKLHSYRQNSHISNQIQVQQQRKIGRIAQTYVQLYAHAPMSSQMPPTWRSLRLRIYCDRKFHWQYDHWRNLIGYKTFQYQIVHRYQNLNAISWNRSRRSDKENGKELIKADDNGKQSCIIQYQFHLRKRCKLQ